LSNGHRAYSVLITSAGARGLRLHFESLSLPSNAVVYVFDPENPALSTPPITSESLRESTDIWTDTLLTDRVAVQIQVPAEASLESANLKIGEVSHVFAAPLTEATAAQCYPNVACYPAYAQAASAVARIAFIASGNIYVCSGALVAGNDSSHYFLTARHCVGSQSYASTLEFYWFYDAPGCQAAAPPLDSVIKTGGGADLLASGEPSDFTLLRLRHAPPGNAYYLRWSTDAPRSAETLACIHHPGGRQKAIDFGKLIGSDANFWGVRWSAGVTEDGSSGAPLLNSQGEIIGQMNAGFNGPGSSCADPTAPDQFGRFDVSFESLRKWLAGKSTPVPVTSTKGIYNGLFYNAGGITPQTAGAITVSTTARGQFTGKLQLGGFSYPFRGLLDQSGNAHISISRRGASALTMELYINPGAPDSLTGKVGDGSWLSEIAADRLVYDGRSSQAPQAGKYTLVVPGSADPNQPEGDSYGTVVINKSGRVKFAGSLADGSKVSRSAMLSRDGQWPLAVSLYAGQGLLVSWMNFADPNSASLGGDVTWIKPAVGRSKFYPNGFALEQRATASWFAPPVRGSTILSFTEGDVALEGGGLEQSIVNVISISPPTRVVNRSPNKLSMTFSTSAGTFRGSVADPNNPRRRISFGGVVLQTQNSGSGFFPGSGRTGKVAVFGY
jgi:hypothetical protein